MSLSMDERLAEDRALRDTSLALVKADVKHLKGDVEERGVGSRIASRFTEGATDLYEQASTSRKTQVGILAALIGAIAIWFARKPLGELLDETLDELADEAPDDTNSEPAAMISRWIDKWIYGDDTHE